MASFPVRIPHCAQPALCCHLEGWELGLERGPVAVKDLAVGGTSRVVSEESAAVLRHQPRLCGSSGDQWCGYQ